jgi:hypothetical protein
MKPYERFLILFIVLATGLILGLYYFFFSNTVLSFWRFSLPFFGLVLASALICWLFYPLLHSLLVPSILCQDSTNSVQKKREEDILFASQLKKNVYQEPVSELGNRHYFENVLREILSTQDICGAIFLIELEGLKEFNNKEGYLSGNELLKQLAV